MSELRKDFDSDAIRIEIPLTISDPLSFSLHLHVERDLDDGIISDTLRQALHDNGIHLSENASIESGKVLYSTYVSTSAA